MGKGGGWEAMRANTATEWKPNDSLKNVSDSFRMESQPQPIGYKYWSKMTADTNVLFF